MPSNKSANDALKGIGSTVKRLEMHHDGKVVEVGQYIKKADAQTPSSMKLTAPDGGKGPYIVVKLDMDAPFVSAPFLGPILHWVHWGMQPDASGILQHEGTPFICDYIGPGPPPGSGPHRYCYFLYEQPEGFDYKPFAPPNGAQYGLTKRMFTSLDEYEKRLKLGPIIACNYYTSN